MINQDQMILRRPRQPTQADWDKHHPLHVPFQSWCPHCAAGAGVGQQHRCDKDGKLMDYATVSMDYAFRIKDELDPDMMPCLVMCDNVPQGPGGIYVIPVDAKGTADYVIDGVVGRLEEAGHSGSTLTLKSDGEEAIMAVKRATAIALKARTTLVESPVRESACNRAME